MGQEKDWAKRINRTHYFQERRTATQNRSNPRPTLKAERTPPAEFRQYKAFEIGTVENATLKIEQKARPIN